MYNGVIFIYLFISLFLSYYDVMFVCFCIFNEALNTFLLTVYIGDGKDEKEGTILIRN